MRIHFMRTTLDIDEDVLETAKELAAKRGTTAGRVLSELARSAWRRAVELRANVTVCPCCPNAELADWSHRRS